MSARRLALLWACQIVQIAMTMFPAAYQTAALLKGDRSFLQLGHCVTQVQLCHTGAKLERELQPSTSAAG